MNIMILLSTMTVWLLLAGCAKESMPQQIGQSSSGPTITSSAGPSESAAASAILNSSTSPAQLKAILAKYTTHQIKFFQSLTIGDQQNAAFAIVQGGDVWYITASEAQKLKSNIAYSADNKFNAPFLWTVDNTKIFKCESSAGGSSSRSYAWYVKGGKPVELPYTGMNLLYFGNGQFTTIGDNFDSGFIDGIGAGHTYKLYYLYWTTDGLKEYGGLKITQQQLLKVKGTQEIIDTITEQGHIIDEIYYRANNLININYHTGDKQNGDFGNVTLVYKNNTVTPELAYAGSNSSKAESFKERNLRDFSYGGIYQAALFSKIATYPDKFPMN
ncbi:putative lipoprotein [Desulfosporosinus sp. OT]|nr:putative lipoprotein [Desulfosporosinus sp. OT]